jgi:hypothetical protein
MKMVKIKARILQSERYGWGPIVKLALPAKVTRRANKAIEIYDRSH